MASNYEQEYKLAVENREKGIYNGLSPDEIDRKYGKTTAPTYEQKMSGLSDYHDYEKNKITGGWYDNADNRKMASTDELRNYYIYKETGKLDHIGKYDPKYDDLPAYYGTSRDGYTPAQWDEFIAGRTKQDYAKPTQDDFTFTGGGGGYSGPSWSDRAKSQAAAEAQAKMDQYNQLLKKIRNQEMSAVNNMDRDYFQRYLQAAQSQTNNGLNAGIAAEQNTRLAMARQAELGDIYQDINAQNFETNNNLARVPVEQLAREHELLTQLEQMGWEREFAEKQLSQADRQFLADLGLRRDQFDWEKAINQRDFDYTSFLNDRNFGYQTKRDARRDAEWESEQKYNRWWEQYQFNNQSAAQRDASSLAWKQLEEQKRQFNSESEWRKYTYNNMSATEQRQFDEQVRQFGEEMAWNLESLRMTQEFQLGMAEAQYSGTNALASDFLK